MCEIDDRASALWSQAEFERQFPEVRQARLEYEQAIQEEEAFRQYLDGLLALPSETERVLAEMEREKRSEL